MSGLRRAAVGGLVGLVRAYQVLLGPLLGGRCRFVPSCSEYFITAVRRKGPVVGTLKGLWRILRCNPFCHGGYDPVDSEPTDREQGAHR